jgi:hypothetical protein
MMRRFALAMAVLSLAGCAGLPVSGPVLVGGPIGVEIRAEVDYLPAGPSEGASQREILDGFIAAGASPQSNYRIARSFLADSTAANWNPARETVVRGAYSAIDTLSATSLSFSADVSARVDERGVYKLDPASSVTTWEFGFTQVGGEWRLNEVPDLTVVTEVAFLSAYDEYTVYFYNHDRTAFIPDVRIFARLGDPVTAVARATIAGPSEYLPNASTAFPEGSELAVAPVEVEGGRAVVDVTDAVQQASTADQRDMLSQIGVSLGQMSGVTASALSVNRVIVPVSAIPGIESNPRVDDRPLIVYNGTVGYSDGQGIEPLEDIGRQIAQLDPTSLSFDTETDSAVVGTRDGVFLVGERTEQVSLQPSIVDPQIGGARSVWWVAPRSAHRVVVLSGATQITISGPWSRSARVVALEVSREDARVAIAVNERGRSAVYVGAISVDENNRPTGVSGFRRLSVVADSILDLAWSDATHVAVLLNRNGVVHAEVATVGGGTNLLGQPQNPVRISGGNAGIPGLVVIAQNEQLWKPRGAGWQSTGTPAELLATQR